MIPKGMTPAEGQHAYQALVAKVKAEFAKKPARTFAGAEVEHEISKAWAKLCGKAFKEEKPAVPTGNEPTAKITERGPVNLSVEVEMPEGPANVPIGKQRAKGTPK